MGIGFATKAIVPKIPHKPESMANDMKRAAKLVSQQIRRDFARTTRTWDKQPDFKVTQKKVGDDYIFSAFTDNQIYIWVNNGTEPHTIRAKNAPFLNFSYPSSPKTTPGTLASKKGSRGSNWASVVEVKHPGTKARKFDEIIQKRFKERWQKEANRILRQYLQRSTRPAGR